MRACVCKKWGPPSSLTIEESLPIPTPRRGEVLVAVAACGVNYPDLLVVQGKYQMKPPLPFAPGTEVSGVITQVGEGCTRFRVGDRVVALVSFGGFATDIVAKEKMVAPLPLGMDFITGASFGLAYGTADYALRERAKLRKGELVLVLGASGGVGLAAVQLAKVYSSCPCNDHVGREPNVQNAFLSPPTRAAGATVIAAASTSDKLQICRDSGADILLNYRERSGDGEAKGGRGGGSWRGALKRLVGERGVDVVVDNVGGADCEPALRSMAIGGRYLVIGFASGSIPAPPLNLVLLKEIAVIGVFFGAWFQRDPEGGGVFTAFGHVAAALSIVTRCLFNPYLS